MLKMTVSVDNVVMMTQVGSEKQISSFTPNPERTLDVIEKQGWYGLITDHDNITTIYKITPAYSEEFLSELD